MNNVRKGYIRPVDFKHGRVDMTHGSGGLRIVKAATATFGQGKAACTQRNSLG